MSEPKNDLRYSEVYKHQIRGDDCCPFWRADNQGICKAQPWKGDVPCTANPDGTSCPVFD